jgi:hypothetical protein
MMQFDLGRIFAWVASLAGVRNVNRFKLQIGSPEAQIQQAEAGNLIAMPSRGKANGGPKGMMPPSAGLPQSNSPIPS